MLIDPLIDPMLHRIFGFIRVSAFWGRNSRRELLYRCRCECGTVFVVAGTKLRCGKTKSCGCQSKIAGRKNRKHGGCIGGISPVYYVWAEMIQRCTNPKNPSYYRYGGRGIRVCKRWRYSFLAFRNDMGPRPEGYTLERKNNNKGYYPNNCKWATYLEQNNNRRPREN